jgi:hypothetical protein
MGAFFKASPAFGKSKAVREIRYQGVLILGQKFDDDGTAASLDETFIQKYDRRLEDLMSALNLHIVAFACENELDINGVEYSYDLNKFDTNIDFIAGAVTFIQ